MARWHALRDSQWERIKDFLHGRKGYVEGIAAYPNRTDPEWRHGHVAVVMAVDLEQGHVAVAEENYDNQPWQNPQAFARQIRLFEVGGRYTLLDVPPTASRNTEGGRIAGWLYPLADR